MRELAGQLLPLVCPLLIDVEPNNRERAFAVTRAVLSLLESRGTDPEPEEAETTQQVLFQPTTFLDISIEK